MCEKVAGRPLPIVHHSLVHHGHQDALRAPVTVSGAIWCALISKVARGVWRGKKGTSCAFSGREQPQQAGFRDRRVSGSATPKASQTRNSSVAGVTGVYC
jgi:hypothetical protein